MSGTAPQLPSWPGIIWTWLKSHGYHLLFGLTLLLLFTLIGWWSVFIRNAIAERRIYHYDSAMDSARIISLSIGHNRSEQPRLGPVAQDPRLEIVRCQSQNAPMHVSLAPFWAELCITPTAEYVEAVETKFKRQLLMVAGESSVLLLAIKRPLRGLKTLAGGC